MYLLLCRVSPVPQFVLRLKILLLCVLVLIALASLLQLLAMKLYVCRTVSEIFSIKKDRDLETGGRSCSRSLKMASGWIITLLPCVTQQHVECSQ